MTKVNRKEPTIKHLKALEQWLDDKPPCDCDYCDGCRDCKVMEECIQFCGSRQEMHWAVRDALRRLQQ